MMYIPARSAGVLAGSSFTPKSLSGLLCWLDASDASTITKDVSNLVSAWTDKSGNSYGVAQSTETNKPLWLTSGIGGKAALQFVSDNYLSFSSGGLDILRNRAGYSIFMSLYLDTGAVTVDYAYFLFFSKGDSSSSLRYQLGLRNFAGIGTYHAWRRLDANSLATNDSTLNYWTEGNARILHSIADFSAGTLKTYRDNVTGALVSSTPTTGSTSDTASLAANVGSAAGEAANFRIGELIIYDSALSDASRAKVETYLKTKWGVS